VIDVEGFGKAYDATIAVADLSFQVRAGEVLGLVGPNGAGKTTTLRALTGIIPSSGGRLRVAGYDLDQSPLEVKRRAAYVPDDPQLFHDLSVEQHLKFIASVYSVNRAAETASRLLHQFDLEQKRHSRAADLSRGMRQKLAICCAYLHDPSALLLDEPMTGLDPRGIRVLKESIVERAQRGAAVIISSHLLAMVEDICSHVLVLDAGRQRFCGTIAELRKVFADSRDDATLEDVFFRAIDQTAPAAAYLNLDSNAASASSITV
jgi:ABC-2 type transport system ATP-binding protein